MKRHGVLAFLALLLLSALLPEAARGEDASKFRFLEGIKTDASVTDLVVTPNDRYVLAISRSSQTLKVIDTWDFSLVQGATIPVNGSGSGADPLCITVSPYGGYAYAGLDSGEVAIINLAPLYELLPYEELEESPAVTYKEVIQGKQINQITALPEVNYANDDVYLLMGTVDRLYWLPLTGGKEPGQPTSWSNAHKVVALDAATTRGLELFYEGGNYKLQTITCSGSCGPLQTDTFKPAAGDTLDGLAIKPYNAHFAITDNISKSKLMLIDTRVVDSMQVGDSLSDSSFSSVSDLELLGGTTTRRAQTMTADGTTVVMVSEVSGSTMEFSGDISGATLGGSTVVPLFSLAAGSPSDGYVYAGSDAGYVCPLTMNPEVIGLTALHGYTVTESAGTSVDFNVQAKETNNFFAYNIYKSHQFGEWGDSINSGSIGGGPLHATEDIFSNDLEECENVITVIAALQGSEGRDAITIYKDTRPPKPGFSLGFGGRKIIVEFTASFLCDLDHYEIFYGSTAGGTVLDSYTVLESTYNKKTISEPLPGEDIEKVIKNLTNGVRYYVYLVIFDESGNLAISGPKSTVPDEVVTLTDQADEEGGVNCLGSVALSPAGGFFQLWGLVFPLLVAVIIRSFTRRRT